MRKMERRRNRERTVNRMLNSRRMKERGVNRRKVVSRGIRRNREVKIVKIKWLRRRYFNLVKYRFFIW